MVTVRTTWVDASEITRGSGPRQGSAVKGALLVITAVAALSGASGCLSRDLQPSHNAATQRLCFAGLTNGTDLQGQVTLPFSLCPRGGAGGVGQRSPVGLSPAAHSTSRLDRLAPGWSVTNAAPEVGLSYPSFGK
jgi:hypothetical protein